MFQRKLSTNTKRIYLEWKQPKSKHSTLCNKNENGGLKNVDTLSKVIRLQCSWIKRLYDNLSHPWKIMPFFKLILIQGLTYLLEAPS